MRRVAVLGLVFAVPGLLGAAALGCSHTLSEAECSRYRDQLIAWAAAKGADRKEAATEFYKTCPGTPVSKSTYACLEKAGDEDAFLKCLGQ